MQAVWSISLHIEDPGARLDTLLIPSSRIWKVVFVFDCCWEVRRSSEYSPRDLLNVEIDLHGPRS